MSDILAYQHKIAQLWNTVNHPKTEPCGLLKDIPNPQLVLAPAPISNDDLFFVSDLYTIIFTIKKKLENLNYHSIYR